MKLGIIGNGFDIAHGIKIEFNDFVESEIFQREIGTYKKYFTSKEYDNFSSGTELWSKFEDFIKHICLTKKIKHNLFMKKIGNIFHKWVSSIDYKSQLNKVDLKTNEGIRNIINCNNIISLNYTDTLNIYGFQKSQFNHKSKPKEWEVCKDSKYYYKIHAFDEKTKHGAFVIGNDSDNKTHKRNSIESWEKNQGFNIKERILKGVLKCKINKIVIFGFSFGTSDAEIIEWLEKIPKEIEIIIYWFKDKPKTIKNKRNITFKKAN